MVPLGFSPKICSCCHAFQASDSEEELHFDSEPGASRNDIRNWHKTWPSPDKWEKTVCFLAELDPWIIRRCTWWIWGVHFFAFWGTIGCSIFPCHPVSPIFGGDNASDGSQERRDPRELYLGMPPGGCELSVSLSFSWAWPRKNCTLWLFDPFLEDLRCFLLRMGIFRSYVQFPQGRFIRIGPSSLRCHQIRSSSVVSHCITSGGWHWKSIGNRSEITPEGSSPLR